LFDYEVKTVYDELYVYKNPPYITASSPLSGETNVELDKVIEIEFSKDVDHASVEAT
jgi:hypothetical protein